MPESASKLRDTDREGPDGRGQPAGFHRVGKNSGFAGRPGRVRVPARRDEEGPVMRKGWRARLPGGTGDAEGSHDDNGVVVRPALCRREIAVAPASGPEADN